LLPQQRGTTEPGGETPDVPPSLTLALSPLASPLGRRPGWLPLRRGEPESKSPIAIPLYAYLGTMDTLTLKILFMIGFISAWVIRIPYQKQNKQNRRQVVRLVLQERILFVFIDVGMIILPLIYIFSPWLTLADYRPFFWTGYLGATLFTISLWLLWRSHHDLGNNWSPTLEIRKGHTFICSGIYQKIRHPMYTAFWLWGAAQALILSNWVAGLGGIIAFGTTYILRIRNEERMMIEQFGEEYKAYMQRTKRLVPYLF
jgi:protein-S-isoprenylcysteine O-methyltransferase Ste14